MRGLSGGMDAMNGYSYRTIPVSWFQKRTLPGLILSTISLAGLLLVSCSRPGPYVELNGKRLTEEDLKTEAPEQYESLRKQYNAQVLDLLKDFANQKILQMEAEKNNQTVDEYVKSLMSKAPMPAPSDVESAFHQLKGAGQIKESISLNEIRGDLMQFLIRNNERDHFQKEMSRLRKEYGFKVPTERVEIDTAGEPSVGSKNAKVTIVEFSDFECPFCRRAQTVNRQLREKYGDKIHWVFKDFPLNFHPHSMQAHKAANCVAKQKPDLYWKFFDEVFDRQSSDKDILKTENLDALASSLGVDMTKYSACLVDPSTESEIKEDIQQGQAVGVSGTPAFFINGRMISGARPLEDFVDIINEEI